MPQDRDFTETCEYLADEMKLSDRERDKFITECHSRAGYRMVPTFVREDDDDDEPRRLRGPRNGGNGDKDKPKTTKTWFGDMPA